MKAILQNFTRADAEVFSKNHPKRTLVYGNAKSARHARRLPVIHGAEGFERPVFLWLLEACFMDRDIGCVNKSDIGFKFNTYHGFWKDID
jgi:hypothetical protein